MTGTKIVKFAPTLLILLLLTAESAAQVRHEDPNRWAANIVVPQSRVFRIHPSERVSISAVAAEVRIDDQLAVTVMDIDLRNHGRRRAEAQLVIPVPKGAVVRGFGFKGAGGELTTRLIDREEARRTYDAIVAQMKDPALLEFIGFNLIKSSAFPIEPMREQTIRVTYENLLESDGNRLDYILPRTESLAYRVPWRIKVEIRSSLPVSTVYSPSHDMKLERKTPGVWSGQISEGAGNEPGGFLLSILQEAGEVSASFIAYPDEAAGGGYFLLLAGPPSDLKPAEAAAIRREVILVIDRSGSMSGAKIKQAREAARQVLEGLEEGERFNILIYSSSVESFAAGPVEKTAESMRRARAYLKGLRPSGGTNIHDALKKALDQEHDGKTLPLVLFLTDGLPTVGKTSERAIKRLAEESNPHRRRIFTFGVGVDVNAPLLDNLAEQSRACSTYVLPREDVEVKVARTFRRLTAPILADPKVEVSGTSLFSSGRAMDVLPENPPDLYEGERLILLGRYIGTDPLTFVISGNYLGESRSFSFDFDLSSSKVKNAYVPRLWASRRIADLIDDIRQAGGDTGGLPPRSAIHSDPKLKELVDEVIRLSTTFGILTEYTAFLATDGGRIQPMAEVRSRAFDRMEERAAGVRTGAGAVNQSLNFSRMKRKTSSNRRNVYVDEDMHEVSTDRVQQVNDLAFFNQGGRWIDGRTIARGRDAEPERTVEFGTEDYGRLVERLVSLNRHGVLALAGEVLIELDGERVLIRNFK